ncbi:acyl carrier protein [Actinomadura sp. 9N215]|uniref:acyl carrier protein n=1 Tax=Actinomadura sp. 9N215 TaxID=3375150 RepID=UPI0037ACE432
MAWGVIGDAGYVARNDLGGLLDSVGFETIGSAEALAALDELLAADADVTAVGRFAWTRAGRFYRTARAPRLGALVSAGEDPDQTADELRTLLAALPPTEALTVVAEQLAKEVAKVMHIDPERLDHHRRLDDYGLDSLMTAELITSLSGRFDVEISPMDLLNSGGTIAGLAEALLLYLGISDRRRS